MTRKETHLVGVCDRHPRNMVLGDLALALRDTHSVFVVLLWEES
jgi:hypothetical protein